MFSKITPYSFVPDYWCNRLCIPEYSKGPSSCAHSVRGHRWYHKYLLLRNKEIESLAPRLDANEKGMESQEKRSLKNLFAAYNYELLACRWYRVWCVWLGSLIHGSKRLAWHSLIPWDKTWEISSQDLYTLLVVTKSYQGCISAAAYVTPWVTRQKFPYRDTIEEKGSWCCNAHWTSK